MNQLNAVLRNLTDFVLSRGPTDAPLLHLLVISVVVGVVMAVVFRFTSNQKKLRRVADLSRAEVLAIKLFKEEPLVMFRALGRLLRHSGMRIVHSLPPMLVMLIPFVLLLTHLAVWYEYRPLEVGEATVVTVGLSDEAWTQWQDIAVESTGPVVVETPPVRDAEEKSLSWRIRAQEPQLGTIHWRVGDKDVEKTIAVASRNHDFMPVSARRPGPGWWDRLIHPGDDGFDADSPVRRIDVLYETRSTPVFGWDVPWWATLLVVSIVAALVVRPLVKVQF